MASGVVRFRRKPADSEREQVAVRWEPDVTQLKDVLEVIRLADPHAQYAVASFGCGPVLIIRYTDMNGDRPCTEYEHVEPGQWLAFSPEHHFLYETDDQDWGQFYDRVPDVAGEA